MQCLSDTWTMHRQVETWTFDDFLWWMSCIAGLWLTPCVQAALSCGPSEAWYTKMRGIESRVNLKVKMDKMTCLLQQFWIIWLCQAYAASGSHVPALPWVPNWDTCYLGLRCAASHCATTTKVSSRLLPLHSEWGQSVGGRSRIGG